MDRKKIIIISSIGVAVLVLMGFLIYLIIPKNSTFGQPSSSESPAPSSTDISLESSILNKIISANIANVAWSDADKKFVAISSDGFLYSINPDSFIVSTTTNFGVSNINKVVWSSNKSRAVIYYNENNISKKFYFDTINQITVPLDNKVGNAVFSPFGDQILYVFNQLQDGLLKTFLSIANPDGTKWKNLSTFPMPDALLYWPSETNKQSNKAYTTSPASGLLPNSVYLIDTKNGSLQKFLDEQNGQQINFSPSGNKLLYSFVDGRGKNLQLFYKNLQTNTSVLLPMKTLAEKCSFDASGENVFCATPSRISSDALMPDDYYSGSTNLSDDIWVYNIESNSASQIIYSEKIPPLNIRYFEVSVDDSYIIFISQQNGELFKLQIK